MSALDLLFRAPACPGLAQSPEYSEAREGQISTSGPRDFADGGWCGPMRGRMEALRWLGFGGEAVDWRGLSVSLDVTLGWTDRTQATVFPKYYVGSALMFLGNVCTQAFQ